MYYFITGVLWSNINCEWWTALRFAIGMNVYIWNRHSADKADGMIRKRLLIVYFNAAGVYYIKPSMQQ